MRTTRSESTLCKNKTFCRVCGGRRLETVISLGAMPPANAFTKKEKQNVPELLFPLACTFCHACGFVGLLDIVSPELLFGNYVYVSSTSPTFVAHFEEFAGSVSQRFAFPAGSLILDIGSNDGILLRPFKGRGWRVLGVDPATAIAAQANENGITTIPAFFTPGLAHTVRVTSGKAHVISATSVFPHIDDLDSVIAGVKDLLHDNGVFIIEAYYLPDIVEKRLFDTIYHEHLSYFTVKTLATLLARLGMEMFDAEKTDTHGGSLRAFIQKKNGPHAICAAVAQFIANENRARMGDIETFRAFARTIEENKRNLTGLLSDLKRQEKRIAAYGAAAKGNTLLNYFGIGADVISYVVDDSPWKQGLYTPGMKIPVVAAEALESMPPDYLLILAWNFAEPIMRKCSAFRERGGKFIIPVPEPRIA